MYPDYFFSCDYGKTVLVLNFIFTLLLIIVYVFRTINYKIRNFLTYLPSNNSHFPFNNGFGFAMGFDNDVF